MTEANITSEIDDLIDTFEASGATWHVIGGSGVIDPYIAFQIPLAADHCDQARRAMEDFAAEFESNAEIRKAVIEHAISIGAYYVELGNDLPVVSEGRTVQ